MRGIGAARLFERVDRQDLPAQAQHLPPATAREAEQRHLRLVDRLVLPVRQEAQHVAIKSHEAGQVGRDQAEAGDGPQRLREPGARLSAGRRPQPM